MDRGDDHQMTAQIAHAEMIDRRIMCIDQRIHVVSQPAGQCAGAQPSVQFYGTGHALRAHQPQQLLCGALVQR